MSGKQIKQPSVSLRAELEVVREAIDGARLLADMVRHLHVENDHDKHAAQHAQAAILTLACRRLLLVDEVLSGDVDVTRLVAPHNAVVGNSDDDMVIQARERR
jgi:hypothetical protein